VGQMSQTTIESKIIDVPSNENVIECTVTRESVEIGATPLLKLKEDREVLKKTG